MPCFKNVGVTTMNSKIVIVDDDEFFLEYLKNLFETSTDYEVITLSNPQKAIKTILKEKPDLVLIDLYMPEMSGLDLGFYIKHNPKTEDTPLMFMSSNPSQENGKMAFYLGAIDLIEKPFIGDELIQKAKMSVDIHEMKKVIKNLLCRLVDKKV